MARKLVTVRKVVATKPIKGADRIELVVIDGWNCIVKKGQFSEGDLAVFFEIDSFLPAEDARWAFLEKNFTSWNGQLGFRVRSLKMKGAISQGLLSPLDDFPEVDEALQKLTAELGEKLAVKQIREMSFEEILKVQKWEHLPQTWDKGENKTTNPLPFFIQRTDQERVQNLPDVFDEWKDKIFQETTKMDGSSMTVYFIRSDSDKVDYLPKLPADAASAAVSTNGRFGVCSRNVDLAEQKGCNFWDTAKRHGLPKKLAALNRNIAIQGELCGSSIQSNFEGFPAGFHDFFLFSVWLVDEQSYLRPREAEAMAAQLGLTHVKIHGYLRLGDIAMSVEELLARAEGTGLNGKKREGIVLKHEDGDFSFKAISNSYLLKHGE